MCLQETPNPFYCWSKKGVTPVVRLKKSKDKIYFFGALSKRSKKVISALSSRCKSKEFIAFLELLKAKYKKLLKPGQKILLVIDNATIHRSKEVKAHLKKNNRGRNRWLELFNFPTYSPDLNPQEHVWKAIRRELSDAVAFLSFKQLVDRACRILMTESFDYKFY